MNEACQKVANGIGEPQQTILAGWLAARMGGAGWLNQVWFDSKPTHIMITILIYNLKPEIK
jgi:hypothetical protein